MNIDLVSANRYTVNELAEIYNQTRVDYLIPMPMNAERLAEYIHDFDIDLNYSMVALINGHVAGLGMLGVREENAWVTRLGVLPHNRRTGIGEAILTKMLEAAKSSGLKHAKLEVIKGNEKAWLLFKKSKFQEIAEYLVLRRAPGRAAANLRGKMTWLSKEEALSCLKSAPTQTWINDYKSMWNALDVLGIRLSLEDGDGGWVVFRKKTPTLTHVILYTEKGDSAVVGQCLLQQLHFLHPRFDTYAENIHSEDPHIPAFHAMGYFEAFRRIEMILDL